MFCFDQFYSLPDKVLNAYVSRQSTLGVSFTNKDRTHVAFVGIGIKGFKFMLYNPTFQSSFLNGIKQNYVPINGISEDSLVGAKMSGSPNDDLWGTYSQFIHAGFIWNKKFKPSLNFRIGWEDILLHDRGFAKYEDPEHGDIDYVGLQAAFYEFKFGAAIPFKKWGDKHLCLNLNAGYRLMNYREVSFGNTPIGAYTTGNLADKYRISGKFTFSISFMVWSNWD